MSLDTSVTHHLGCKIEDRYDHGKGWTLLLLRNEAKKNVPWSVALLRHTGGSVMSHTGMRETLGLTMTSTHTIRLGHSEAHAAFMFARSTMVYLVGGP